MFDPLSGNTLPCQRSPDNTFFGLPEHAAFARRLVACGCIWRQLQHLARERFPHNPEQWLSEQRLCRTRYLRIKKLYMAGDPERAIAHDIVCHLSAKKAATMGLCTEQAGGTVSHPSPQRMAYGDVTVLDARFRGTPDTRVVNRKTGEIRTPRFDPDARFVKTGTGKPSGASRASSSWRATSTRTSG